MFIILDNVYEDGRISISHAYYSNYRIMAANTILSSPHVNPAGAASLQSKL